MEYNQRLKELRILIYEKNKVVKAIELLNHQIEPLVSKEKKLKTKREMYESTIQDLEKTSIETIILRLLKLDESHYNHQKKEADQAILNHQVVYDELNMLKTELVSYQNQLNQIYAGEEEYARLIKEKEAYVKENYPKEKELILKVENEIGYLEGQLQEINEAKEVGNKALKTCQRILKILEDTSTFGTLDVLNIGIGNDMIKYSYLSEAKEFVERLKRQLSRFKTELLDIQIDDDLSFSMNNYTFIGDFFFDHFFAELSFLDHLSAFNKKIVEMKQKVKSIIKQLEELETLTNTKKNTLQKEIEHIVYQVKER